MKMLRRLKKTALLSTLCATSVGAVVGGISSPALATTCNFGGPPSQLYCANSTWTSGDGWTNVIATIEEDAYPGGGPGQRRRRGSGTALGDERRGALSGRVFVRSKSRPPASFLAPRSRGVSGCSPHRHSIIRRIDVCSYGPPCTGPEGEKGDTTT